MIGHIYRRINAFQYHQVAFDPITKGEEFDIDVPCSCGRLLRVAHGSTPVIIFVEKGSSFLWNVEVAKNAAYIENHFTGVTSRHKFGFSTRPGDCRLKTAFVSNGAAGESYAYPSK